MHPTHNTLSENIRAQSVELLNKHLAASIDLQAQGALQLIESLPQPATNSPPNLGQGVNTFA